MRKASEIEIYHPTTMSSEEAQTLWVDYMARCRRRHLPWLVVNALLSPISLLLAPIPGPNLIGYWFAYRAVKDLLALLGLRHAQDSQVATTFRPREVLAIAGPTGEHTRLTETNATSFAALAAESLP